MPRRPIRVRMSEIGARRKGRRRAPDAPPKGGLARFLRFAGASVSCTFLDQLLAGVLFSVLRAPLHGAGFLRITVANVLARCVSLSLNYALNHRLVFTLDMDDHDDPQWRRSARRESLPRFLALSAFVLACSTTGVYVAHTFFGAVEWKAKLLIDLALFFLNYNVQRTWVFRDEVTVSPPRTRRTPRERAGS